MKYVWRPWITNKITMHELIDILEESVKKHWEKPLTNKWLLNILKKSQEKQEYEDEKEYPDIY